MFLDYLITGMCNTGVSFACLINASDILLVNYRNKNKATAQSNKLQADLATST